MHTLSVTLASRSERSRGRDEAIPSYVVVCWCMSCVGYTVSELRTVYHGTIYLKIIIPAVYTFLLMIDEGEVFPLHSSSARQYYFE